MTSKEFIRRCEFFAVFDKAAMFFYNRNDLDSIYKVSVFSSSWSLESYVLSILDFYDYLSSFDVSFHLAYIEVFSRSQFLSQFKYFLSFLSRLSERQMSSLVSSGRFDNLLKFKDKINI